jgi:hypothetical protein
MSGNREQSLQSLTSQSSLLVLLRTLYGMVLDYCVLKSLGDSEKVIVFTKDQLISLIERSSPDTSVGDLPKLAARGLFRSVIPPESDNTRVLVVEEEGASVSSIREALASGPVFPEWWGAPVALAVRSAKKLYFNPTAVQTFGPELKRLASCSLPDRDEFLVELEGSRTACLLTFRRLEQNVFILEDSTGDAALAEDIAWWASIGKAWVATLDGEKRSWRRCAESEIDVLREGEKNMVLPCEWEGRLLGYFCVENPGVKRGRPAGAKGVDEKSAGRNSDVKSAKKPARRAAASVSKTATRRNEAKDETKRENEPLNVLGPQAMGFLTPGTNFAANVPGDLPDEFSDRTVKPQKAKETGKGKESPRKRTGGRDRLGEGDA